MWHALRAELAYNRSWLLGGLGLAAGIALLLSVILHIVGKYGVESHVAPGLRGMFLIMAPMIVGFIVQTYRSEERRARLLLAGPVTPRQIAWANALLPVVLFGVGVLAAGAAMGIEVLLTGRLELAALDMVVFVGGMLFAYVQLGLLAQETTAARGQRRLRAAAAGWGGFAAAVLVLAGLYLVLALGVLTWTHILLGHLAVAAAATVASVELYAGRTDFTR